MWSIKINKKDQYMHLAPKTTLTYTMVNPAFDAQQTENPYAYSFKAPIGPHNAELLEWAFRMDRNDINFDKEWDATLYVEGVPFKYGLLKLKSHSEKDFECEFFIPGRDLLKKLELIPLTSLSEVVEYTPPLVFPDYNGYGFTYADVPFAGPPNVFLEITIGETTIRSPFYATGYWNSLMPVAKNAIVEDFKDQINTVMALGVDIAHTVVPSTGYKVLMIRDTVIEVTDSTVFAGGILILYDQYSLRSLMTKQEMWRDHVLEVNYNDEYNYCWPMVLAPDSAFGDDILRKKYWNMMSGNLYWFNFPKEGKIDELKFLSGTFAKAAQYVPQPKVRWILQQILDKAGVLGILGDAVNNVDIQSSILLSNVNMSRIQVGPFKEFEIDFNEASSTMVPLLRWDLGWTMPSGNAKEFLITFCDYFGMYWRYVGDALEFVKKVDQLRTAQEDWTNKCEPYYERSFVSKGAEIIKYKDVDGIPLVEGQLEQLGTEGDIVELPANTLPHLLSEDKLSSYTIDTLIGWVEDVDFREWKTPYWVGPSILSGINDGKRTTNSVPSFTFLFWRGPQPDSEGDLYGLAGHDTTNLNDDEVGTLNLDMNAEDWSIYEERWKDIFAQKNTHKININVRLGLQELIRMERWTNTVKRIYTPLGTILGVVMSIEATFISDIYMNEVICKVELGVLR